MVCALIPEVKAGWIAERQIGFTGGGQMVNQFARGWLTKQCPDWNALNCDIQWTLNISSQIDRCKRIFNGQSSHNLYDGNGRIVTIPS
jgi:hypothetical protein